MSQWVKILLFLTVCTFFGLKVPGPSMAAENLSKEIQVQEKEEREKQGNIFNMIFGSAPGMPTERGLLLINAYHDNNGNQAKDSEEPELRNEIVCRVDGIQYHIPAFIPALRLHENYRVECATAPASSNYVPEKVSTELFIQRKGQVFFIEVPCKKLEPAQPPSS